MLVAECDVRRAPQEVRCGRLQGQIAGSGLSVANRFHLDLSQNFFGSLHRIERCFIHIFSTEPKLRWVVTDASFVFGAAVAREFLIEQPFLIDIHFQLISIFN